MKVFTSIRERKIQNFNKKDRKMLIHSHNHESGNIYALVSLIFFLFQAKICAFLLRIFVLLLVTTSQTSIAAKTTQTKKNDFY